MPVAITLTAILEAIFVGAQSAYDFILNNLFLAIPFCTASIVAVVSIVKRFAH